eukprot:753103_1
MFSGFTESAMAGAMTGYSEGLLVAPFELTKVRMMAPDRLGMYKSSVECARAVFRTEGVRGFFCGAGCGMLRNGVWNGTYFGIIDVMRKSLWVPKDHKDEILRNIVAGTCGGTLATVFNNPLDVVASRKRNVLRGEVSPYRWNIPAVFTIARTEGIRAIYKGFPAKVLRLGPGGGILLVVVEILDKKIRHLIHFDEKK